MLKVTKFGGSSMASAEQYRKIRDIILSDPSRKVVIVSAAGKRSKLDHKITDLLYLCHAHIQYGVECDRVFDSITERYLDIRQALGLSYPLEQAFYTLKHRLDNGGVSRDALVSRGEYYSARLMAEFLDFDFVDAAHWVQFNLDGSVDQEASYTALRELYTGKGMVIPGFYGRMPDGQLHTFSRGGSDITGALAAAALDADVYENWTDVSGILMADPRIVEDPRPIAQVTFDELRELSYAGAQVLHQATIAPVREKNIPVNIRNTNDPQAPGTLIQEQFENDHQSARLLTGITGKKDFSVLSLDKTGPGCLGRLLAILEGYGLYPDHTLNSVDKLSVILPTEALAPCLYPILGQIQQKLAPKNLKVLDQMAIIAAVGRRMAEDPSVPGRMFGALGGIPIHAISAAPDRLSIAFAVENRDFDRAIRVLYDSFEK